jgi:hypothetical protein
MRLRRFVLIAVAAALVPLGVARPAARASDHADTAENVNRIGADLTDLFIFPNPSNVHHVVLVMNSHGLIPAGQGEDVGFDPRVLYQFKIDTTGDFVEDLVIQFRFHGVAPHQKVLVAGPRKPFLTGTTTIFTRPHDTIGRINHEFSPADGMKVFAGVRSEPFFFDLNRFYAILPDRMTPLTGKQVDFASIKAADTPEVNGFRGFPPASGFDSTPAMDYLANLNVMSIVVELPRHLLSNGLIRVWITTSIASGDDDEAFAYTQQDRLARPVVNEVLATVTQRRHEVNNKDNPSDDANQLEHDIRSFLTFPAGRSAAIQDVIASVLVPDVMVADLSQRVTTASYLGVETGGFTGSKFGGRALRDDVVDISLSTVFGDIVPALKLAPDDGAELPQFTTDHVGPHHDYANTFPYLGGPH